MNLRMIIGAGALAMGAIGLALGFSLDLTILQLLFLILWSLEEKKEG